MKTLPMEIDPEWVARVFFPHFSLIYGIKLAEELLGIKPD